MNTLHIKKGDLVVVLSGDDKGTRGKVIAVSPAEGKVMVEGVNKVKKHNKARRQGDVSSIVETEGAVYACKVAIVCPKCGKAARIGYKVLDNGKKVRMAAHKKCGYPEI